MDKSKIESRFVELLGKLENGFNAVGHNLSSYLVELFRYNNSGRARVIFEAHALLVDYASLKWSLVDHKPAVRYRYLDLAITIPICSGIKQNLVRQWFEKTSFYSEKWSEKRLVYWNKGWFIDTVQLTYG